jgi:hypothetical protein
MESITIEFIYGTVLTLVVLSYGFYRGIFYFRDKNNQTHIYDASEIKGIIKGE